MVATLAFEPIVGLYATFEVCDTTADRRVLGVIAEDHDGRWRVLSTRYGTPEPQPGPHATREAAAATLLTEGTTTR